MKTKHEIRSTKYETKRGLPREAKRSGGMTLFMAVTIMAILLFISFAVVNIAVKSTLFSSSGRDSQFAFYAADAGIECALYWDTKNDISKFDPTVSGSSINCAGSTLTAGSTIIGTTTQTVIGGDGGTGQSAFGFTMTPGQTSAPCAIVTVAKFGDDTFVKSRGYNTCDTSNPRRVERGVEVNY